MVVVVVRLVMAALVMVVVRTLWARVRYDGDEEVVLHLSAGGLIALSAVAITTAGPLSLLVVLAAAVILLPGPFAWWVAIPLGQVQLAYYLVRYNPIRGRKTDGVGLAVLAGALAAVRAGGDGAHQVWLERRLLDGRLCGAGIAASGFLAAMRRDLKTARLTLDSLGLLDAGAVPARAAELAREWLAADAVRRGAWDDLLELGQKGGPTSPITAFMLVVGRRMSGHPIGDDTLEEAWLDAGSPVAFQPLLEHARAWSPSVAATPEAAGPDPLESALRAHVAALRGAPDKVRLMAAARAWDQAVLSDSVRHGVRERATELRVADAQAALDRMVAAASVDLGSVAAGAGIALEDVGAVSGAARRRVREQHVESLELAVAEVRRRVEEKRPLVPVDEWREFVGLTDQYRLAVTSAGDTPRLVFASMFQDVLSLAVWLWNVRGEPAMARAIFRWLLGQAEVVGDERAAELLRSNLQVEWRG